jgi:hypothetical protein
LPDEAHRLLKLGASRDVRPPYATSSRNCAAPGIAASQCSRRLIQPSRAGLRSPGPSSSAPSMISTFPSDRWKRREPQAGQKAPANEGARLASRGERLAWPVGVRHCGGAGRLAAFHAMADADDNGLAAHFEADRAADAPAVADAGAVRIVSRTGLQHGVFDRHLALPNAMTSEQTVVRRVTIGTLTSCSLFPPPRWRSLSTFRALHTALNQLTRKNTMPLARNRRLFLAFVCLATQRRLPR